VHVLYMGRMQRDPVWRREQCGQRIDVHETKSEDERMCVLPSVVLIVSCTFRCLHTPRRTTSYI
jgi:hypothetical protein